MTNKTKISFVLWVVIGVYCSPLLATTANIKWCANWPTKFRDAGVGEDVYTAQDTVEYSPAQYAKAKIRKVGTTNWLFDGYLDTDGCTTTFATDTSSSYEFRTYYTRYHSGRTIHVNPDAFAADSTYKGMTVSTPSSFGWNVLTVNYSVWNICTNMAQLAGKALQFYQTRNWPAGSTVYMSTMDNPACVVNGVEQTSAANNQICINQDQVASDGNHYNHGIYKFVIAHEMGHVQANGTGSPGAQSAASYANTNWPVYGIPHKCNCVQNNPSDPNSAPTVCVRSRSFIETAAKEGWANFWSASLLNNRSSTNGYMALWTQTYAMVNGTPTWDSSPPVQFSMLQRWKWMENYCGTNMSNKGIITDWMQFFWQVWTMGGDNRYDMSELSTIWSTSFNTFGDGGDNPNDTEHPDTDGGFDEYAKWESFVTILDDGITLPSLTANKIEHFTTTGSLTGVDH